jgi:hypothetical protein
MTQAVRKLAYLFREEHRRRPVLLLGAGASYRSGIPLAGEAVRRIARDAFARNELGTEPAFANVKVSDWEPYLQGQPWFIRDPVRFAENFPLAVEHLLRPRELRRTFFLEMAQARLPISSGYKHLASFMLRGLINTVLTTNFDRLVVEGLRDINPHLNRIAEVNRVANDRVGFDILRSIQVVYLHGAVDVYTDLNLESETRHLDHELVSLLHPLLLASPLVVIGYRGYEQSIMTDLLGNEAATGGFRNGLYWCSLQKERIHANVEALQASIGTNFELLRIDGFDELFDNLAGELSNERIAPLDRRAKPDQLADALDETLLKDASVEDLDQALVLSSLTSYAERIHRSPVTSDSFTAFMLELGLLKETEGRIVPTFGCFLLFGRDLHGRAPWTSIGLTLRNKQHRLISGNLIEQYSAIFDYLNSAEINPTLRVKGELSSTERRAYPTRALREMLTNMIVHRDYAIRETATIDVLPGESISFSNPGGLPDQLRRQLSLGSDGSFKPIRSLSEVRNPSLADVFYGLGPMDKAGTGLADVHEMMHDNGGETEFSVAPGNAAFRATLLQPLQVGGKSVGVAVQRGPVGIYVTNLLPFSVLPSAIFFGDWDARAILRERHPSEVPIFVRHNGGFASFADLSTYSDRPRGSAVKRCDVSELLTSGAHRNIFVWLLRKHFEFYLLRFRRYGLVIDPDRRHRAYFTIVSGKRNTIIYNGAVRSNIRRDVVKPRGDQGNWHENEGLIYTIVEFDGTWATQLKPFYMFTRSDGATPLWPSLRTARATRRMRFDRNKSVADDLTFWARFLAEGASTINIGGVGVPNVVIKAAYETIEVADEGLESADTAPIAG